MKNNIVSYLNNREIYINRNNKLYYFYCINCLQKYRFNFPNRHQLSSITCSQKCYNMINYKEYYDHLLALT